MLVCWVTTSHGDPDVPAPVGPEFPGETTAAPPTASLRNNSATGFKESDRCAVDLLSNQIKNKTVPRYEREQSIAEVYVWREVSRNRLYFDYIYFIIHNWASCPYSLSSSLSLFTYACI